MPQLTVSQTKRLQTIYPGCRFLLFSKPQSIKSILEGLLGYKMKSKLLPKKIIRAVSTDGRTVAVLNEATWEVIYRYAPQI